MNKYIINKVGSGSYDQNGLGHECLNHVQYKNGNYYGYITPYGNISHDALVKVNTGFKIDKKINHLDDVTVIFIDSNNNIVGFYKDATVFQGLDVRTINNANLEDYKSYLINNNFINEEDLSNLLAIRKELNKQTNKEQQENEVLFNIISTNFYYINKPCHLDLTDWVIGRGRNYKLTPKNIEELDQIIEDLIDPKKSTTTSDYTFRDELFDLLTIIGKDKAENIYSNWLVYIINPEHYTINKNFCITKFISIFDNDIACKINDETNITVKREAKKNKGRIDILIKIITSDAKIFNLVIEVKVDANLGEKQIEKYQDFAENTQVYILKPDYKELKDYPDKTKVVNFSDVGKVLNDDGVKKLAEKYKVKDFLEVIEHRLKENESFINKSNRLIFEYGIKNKYTS
jgi:hypothetical protein